MHPAHNLGPKPLNIHGRIVPSSSLSLGISSPTHIHHMDQGISMSQVIQELVSQPPSLMRSWYKSCHVQEFNGNGTPPFMTTTVIWPTPIRDAVSLTGAFYLKVSDGSLGVNCGEAAGRVSLAQMSIRRGAITRQWRGWTNGKLPISHNCILDLNFH